MDRPDSRHTRLRIPNSNKNCLIIEMFDRALFFQSGEFLILESVKEKWVVWNAGRVERVAGLD